MSINSLSQPHFFPLFTPDLLEPLQEKNLKQKLDQFKASTSLDELKSLINGKQSLEQFLTIAVKQLEIDQYAWMKPENGVKSAFLKLKNELSHLLDYIKNFINLFVDTLNVVNINRNSISLWDRQLILFIISKFLLIPGLIIQVLLPLFGVDSKIYLIAYAALGLLGLTLYIYKKFVQPGINSLSNAENMKEAAQHNRLKHRVIQPSQLKEVVYRLNRHLMIVGAPGVGKTALVESLVQLSLQESKIPESERILPKELSKRKFFRVDCKALGLRNMYTKADQMQRLKNELEGHEKETVLILDEVHMALNSPECFEAMKPFLDQKDLVCIAMTTPQQWEEIKKKYDGEEALSDRWSIYHLPSATEVETEIVLRDFYQQRSKEILKTHGLYILIEKDCFKKIVQESRQLNKALPRTAVNCLDDLMNRCLQASSSTYFMPELEQLKLKQKLLDHDSQIETAIAAATQELEARKNAAKKIQALKRREVQFKKECFELSQHKKFKNREDLQKLFLIYYFHLLPLAQQAIAEEVKNWEEKMQFRINDALIKDYFKDKRKQEKEEK